MFNFFNKKEAIVKANEVAAKYPAVVEEIHKTFMTAGEKLLKEAKEIIANATVKDEEKVNRLRKIGFVNAGQVKQAEVALERKRKAEQNAAIVEMYAIRYPQYKFITEETVKQVCEKYKLVMGAIGKYKGFVPEKNLLEIEAFNVKDEDCHQVRHRRNDDMYLMQMMAMQNMNSLFGGLSRQSSMERELERQYQRQLEMSMQLPTYDAQPEPTITYKREFLICAPQKDMKIESWEMVEGHKIVHVPDPVVLHPVKNGYLIVTAWGDEASDELVVNQTNN
jgi:hypothetical protein